MLVYSNVIRNSGVCHDRMVMLMLMMMVMMMVIVMVKVIVTMTTAAIVNLRLVIGDCQFAIGDW